MTQAPSKTFQQLPAKRLLAADSDDDDEDHSDEEEEDLAFVPLLCDDVVLDDKGASVILVFPRGQTKKVKNCDRWVVETPSGTLDLNAEKADAYQSARRIFRGDHKQTSRAVFASLLNRPVTNEQFQTVVRHRLLEVFQQAGLQASSAESVDGDEVILKVGLDRKGPVIRRLAQKFEYKMPFSHKAYENAKPQGEDYGGGEPMRNARGQAVPAYRSYSSDLADVMDNFRQVDEIRLIYKRIRAWISVRELRKQGIVTRCFPAAVHAEVMELHNKWASIGTCLLQPLKWIPDHKFDMQVRNYFGELIAFFFHWFGYYTRSMVFVALATTICSGLPFLDMILNGALFGYSLTVRRWLQNGFAVYMIIWASLFNEFFKRRSARCQQIWGMKDWDTDALVRDDWDQKLEGSQLVRRRRFCTSLVVVLYCTLFASVIAGFEVLAQRGRDEGEEIFTTYQPYILSIMIKVGSLLWGKIAVWLVAIENHRTEERFTDRLAWILSVVKIFVALWPFIFGAFLRGWFSRRCRATLGEAAYDAYSYSGWPIGVGLDGQAVNASIPPESLSFLGEFTYPLQMGDGTQKICLSGCFPVDCSSSDGQTHCLTNCLVSLQTDLLTFYLFDLVVHLVFDLLVPICLTYREVQSEIHKVEKESGTPGNRPSYTYLQFQAKCHSVAPYEYDSWGGSYTQDFLNLVIGYTLMACFSQVQPKMVVIGLFSLMAEYRILAFRMANVTCRPWPDGSEGIGSWQDVLDTASTLAVTCNVGLAVFLMEPLKNLPIDKRLIVFIVSEKVLLTLRFLVAGALPDKPDDVRRIDDFNTDFEKTLINRMLNHPVSHATASELADYSQVDISLRGVSDEEERLTPMKGTLAFVPSSASGSDADDADDADEKESDG